jgi:hypothetical protein
VVGGIIIVCLIIAGVYYYIRDRGQYREMIRSNQPLREEVLHPQYRGPGAPNWERTNINRD